MDNLQNFIIKYITDKLDVAPDFTKNVLIQDIPGWDSIFWTDIIISVESEYNVELDLTEIGKSLSVQDLITSIHLQL